MRKNMFLGAALAAVMGWGNAFGFAYTELEGIEGANDASGVGLDTGAPPFQSGGVAEMAGTLSGGSNSIVGTLLADPNGVDFFRFTLPSSGTLDLVVSAFTASGLDAYLGLYDGGATLAPGTLIAGSDNQGTPVPGTVTQDPRIGVTPTLAAGDYYAAISSALNLPAQVILGGLPGVPIPPPGNGNLFPGALPGDDTHANDAGAPLGFTPGAYTLSILFTPSATPALSVNGPLDFGNVRVGTTSAGLDATATNSGTGGSLVGTFGGAPGASDFSPSTDQAFGPLAATETASRSYVFAPTGIGAASETIDVTSNAGNDTIDLLGEGVGPELTASAGVGSAATVAVAPALIDFGAEMVGTDAIAKLVIANIFGTDLGDLTDLTILSATLTGGDAGLFSLVGFTPGTVISAAGGSSLFDLVFSPTSVLASLDAQLVLTTDVHVAKGASGGVFTFGIAGSSYQPSTGVPEPATLALLGLGLAGLGGMRRRRSR